MANSYDEVPYTSHPFPQSHPNRLATIAHLHGMTPAPLAKARVLELACSSGGNIVPIAEQFPGCSVTGVDASERAIREGNERVKRSRLENVKLLCADILQVEEQLEEYDYIIAHGVFSWVKPEVQQKILQLCSRHLSSSGVAYVSYNAYPGWRFRGTIRDVMCYRARFFDDPEAKLRESRALVDFLASAAPQANSPYGMLLHQELDSLKKKEDYYLFHEYLEEENRPFYFHEFCELAAGTGLQYLGEADFSMMSVNNLPPEIARRVADISGDVIQQEQYMDFIRNRMFRQTLLVHANHELSRPPQLSRLMSMSVATNAQPEQPLSDLHSGERVTFRRAGSTMTTSSPLVKAAMLHLAKVWPRWTSFDELLRAARAKLSEVPTFVDARRDQQDAETLAAPLLRCYATTHVDLAIDPLQPRLDLQESPRASRWARALAEESSTVTNLWHELVQLSDVERHLLEALDGTRNRQAIVQVLVEKVQQGSLVIRDQGELVLDPQHIHQLVDGSIDGHMAQIRNKGLLL